MDGKLKPWQIVLFIAALGAVAFAVYSVVNPSGKPNLAESVLYVDVESGQLFRISTSSRMFAVPAENPETKRYTLLPVYEDENGVYKLSERYKRAITDMDVDPKAVVDLGTGEVRVAN